MNRLAFLVWLALAAPVLAVQPDEVLDDPSLEARARGLSQELRCLVCRNENIDESNADLARDLRLAVRERLVAGDSDEEVIDYLVSRYGEYVLLSPRANGANLILWLSGPVLLLLGLGIAWTYVGRRERVSPPPGELSPEERDRLRRLLEE